MHADRRDRRKVDDIVHVPDPETLAAARTQRPDPNPSAVGCPASLGQRPGQMTHRVAAGIPAVARFDAAFARLRAYAFTHHQLLGAVARDVVARRLRFAEDS